jgi:flagellar hook-basal body complex protein FliE
MAASPINAAAAYQAVARLGTGGAGGAESALPNLGTGATGGDFSSFLNDAVKSTVDTMRSGEAAAAQGAAGKGDIVQVVNAVTAAELTLETVVAVRDKVISAYQDIMRMPI